jgi:hypothetical protein
MRAFIRSLARRFSTSSELEIWPQRDWCCRSCADAWLLGRLSEAARARDQAGVRLTGSERA